MCFQASEMIKELTKLKEIKLEKKDGLKLIKLREIKLTRLILN